MINIFFTAAIILNLVCLFFIIVQISNIINSLEEILSEKDVKNNVQLNEYEDDLSLRLKDFQKMKFSGINKNEK